MSGSRVPFSQSGTDSAIARHQHVCHAQGSALIACRGRDPTELEDTRAGIFPSVLSASSPPTFPLLRLSQTSRQAWMQARTLGPVCHSDLLSPTVRTSYPIPSEDWAFLGAVRHPDDVLAEATDVAQCSPEGVPFLAGPRRLGQLSSCLHDQM